MLWLPPKRDLLFGIPRAAHAPAAAPAAVTWDSANKGADVVLSNGSLTATNPSSYESVRATASKSAGKWHFQINPSIAGGFTVGVGICNASADMSTYLHASSNAIVYWQTGEIFEGGTLRATISPFESGDLVVIDYDADAKKVWFGKWYTNDPSSGGLTYSVTGAMFPAVTLYGGAIAAALFTGSANVPSGYSELT